MSMAEPLIGISHKCFWIFDLYIKQIDIIKKFYVIKILIV